MERVEASGFAIPAPDIPLDGVRAVLAADLMHTFDRELRAYLLPRLPGRLKWAIDRPRALRLLFRLRIVRRPTAELESLSVAEDGNTIRVSQRVRFHY